MYKNAPVVSELVSFSSCPEECCTDRKTCEYVFPTTSSMATADQTTSVADDVTTSVPLSDTIGTTSLSLPTSTNPKEPADVSPESPVALIVVVVVAVLFVSGGVLVFCVVKSRGRKEKDDGHGMSRVEGTPLEEATDAHDTFFPTDQYQPISAAKPLHHQANDQYSNRLSDLAQAESQRDHYQPIDKPQRQYGSALSAQSLHQQQHHYEDVGAL